MFRKILVGYDGSASAKAALQEAADMAKRYSAEITAIWVREPLPRHSDLPGEFEGEAEAAEDYFKARREEIAAVAKAQGIEVRCESRSGHPAKTILSFAAEGRFDLIVAGHSDHSGLWGRLLGDTADRLTDHAHCSVLIVKN
jgi:nucleotide-binding universal stress UspA family protein